MSDREFDNYLTLLSGLLRLDSKQRRAIAEELRSHLELIEQGVSKDEAIQEALAEFGDAAGLAGQFTTISWQRKRRWLMRLTTFSVAAMILLAAGLTIFWPGRNAAPGVASVVAQDPPAPAQASAEVQPAPRGENKLAAALDRRIDVDFQNVPLKEVAAYMTKLTGVTFCLSAKKLEEAGVSLDSPINSTFRNVRLSTWLEIFLKELELTYFEKDDLVIITTPEDAESRLLIRVYDCRDLLAMGTPAARRAPAATQRGAGGLLKPPVGASPVAGTGYLGAEIDDATETRGLRVIRVKPSGPARDGGLKDGDLITAVGGKRIDGIEDFDEILNKLLPGDRLGIAYERDGVTSLAQITLSSRPNTAVVAEQKPSEPTADPNSAPSTAPSAVPSAPSGSSSAGGRGMGGRLPSQPQSEYDRRADDLIELVTSIVQPDSWDDVGGPGAIDAYSGLVVVAQTDEVHKKVERLFDMLREAAGLEVKPGKVVK
jgi:PDZ domain